MDCFQRVKKSRDESGVAPMRDADLKPPENPVERGESPGVFIRAIRKENQMKNAVSAAGLVFTLLFLSGCASTDLVDMWKDPEYKAPPFAKMFVVAVHRDAARRRLWEDGFVAELAKYGVASTPSYRLFPTAVPDTLQLLDTVKARGYDGILLVRRLPESVSIRHYPGYAIARPSWWYDSFYEGYYPYYYQEIRPAYTDTEKIAQRGIDVWSVAEDGRMIWTAISNSEETSSNFWQKDIIDVTVKELARWDIIPPKR
jgi:hypothetical protein